MSQAPLLHCHIGWRLITRITVNKRGTFRAFCRLSFDTSKAHSIFSSLIMKRRQIKKLCAQNKQRQKIFSILIQLLILLVKVYLRSNVAPNKAMEFSYFIRAIWIIWLWLIPTEKKTSYCAIFSAVFISIRQKCR